MFFVFVLLLLVVSGVFCDCVAVVDSTDWHIFVLFDFVCEVKP